MKLLRHGPPGRQRPGLLDPQGRIRHRSGPVPDIATGTPPGAGMGRKPSPVFLRPGQLMRLGIDAPGGQRQRVVDQGQRQEERA